MTDPHIAEIAAKLTAAQREALLAALPYILGDGAKVPYSHRRALPGLKKKGLASSSMVPSRLTPLGQSVAAYLKEQSSHE